MILIKDLMLHNPPFLYVNNKVSHARLIFGNSKFSSIPVIYKNGALAGILDKNIVQQEHLSPLSQVGNYIYTCESLIYENDPVAVISGLNIEKTSILPVLSREGKLMGIIPVPMILKDILDEFIKCLELVAVHYDKDPRTYGIIIVNDDGEIVYFNGNTEKITGIHGKEVFGIHINKVLYDSKLHEVVKKGKTHLSARMNADNVVLCTNRFPLHKDGVIVAAVGIFEDISEKERLHEKLRSLRGLNLEMVGILESINDGIILADNNGSILRTNSAFEAISGLSASQILSNNYDYLVEHANLPAMAFWGVLEKKRPFHVLEHINGRDFMVASRPVFDTDGHLLKVIVFIKDIYHLNEMILNLQLTQELATRYCNDRDIEHCQYERDDMVASSKAMKRVVSLAHKVAKVDSNILITGETGVGKEVVARSVHNCSHRMDGPFIKLNCGAIPEHLLESELFGYESGAFTGAKKEGKIGLIELSDYGTLFLDEVADLPIALQVKLLRVLQEREVMRVGGTKSKKVDFRLIAATNKDLEQMVKEQNFREDLFYRLNVVPVTIPPLRERKEDIIPLVLFFLNKFNKKYNLGKKISPEVIQSLLKYDWPGNIRELENTIERLIVTSDSNLIQIDEMKQNTSINIVPNIDTANSPKALGDVLEETERNLIYQAFKNCKTTREMADTLGISQSAVVKKMKKYGISKVANG